MSQIKYTKGGMMYTGNTEFDTEMNEVLKLNVKWFVES